MQLGHVLCDLSNSRCILRIENLRAESSGRLSKTTRALELECMSFSILELRVVNAFVFYAVAFVIGGAVADEYGSRHADYLDRMGLF